MQGDVEAYQSVIAMKYCVTNSHKNVMGIQLAFMFYSFTSAKIICFRPWDTWGVSAPCVPFWDSGQKGSSSLEYILLLVIEAQGAHSSEKEVQQWAQDNGTLWTHHTLPNPEVAALREWWNGPWRCSWGASLEMIPCNDEVPSTRHVISPKSIIIILAVLPIGIIWVQKPSVGGGNISSPSDYHCPNYPLGTLCFLSPQL